MLIYISENIFNLPKKDQVVGFYLYDKFNETIARVDALLAEPDTHFCRYMIINLGGFLQIQGKQIVLPLEICEVQDLGKLKTQWRKESMLGAPSPVDIKHMTASEEELILDYFELKPYWREKPSENSGV